MPQYKADEHDSMMQHAAKHSTYKGHDGKANAPLPFLANPGALTTGQPDEQVEDPRSGQGKKDAPQAFNAQKGRAINVKGKSLSQGKTG